MPYLRSARVCPASTLPNPAARFVFVSVAVNSTNPSPFSIVLVEDAPAFQPAAPVLVKLSPEMDTPALTVQTRFPTRTLVNVAFTVFSDVSTRRGYFGFTPLE